MSSNQEPDTKIRARSRTPTNPATTATNSDDLNKASDSEKGNASSHSASCVHTISLLSSTVLIPHTETEALLSIVDNKTLSKTI